MAWECTGSKHVECIPQGLLEVDYEIEVVNPRGRAEGTWKNLTTKKEGALVQSKRKIQVRPVEEERTVMIVMLMCLIVSSFQPT